MRQLMQVDAHAELRLQALAQLYNMLSGPAERLQALLNTLAFAQRAGLAAQLAPSVKVLS